MKNPGTWNSYHEKTKSLPPSPILLEALAYTKSNETALDLGAGALRNTRYLLEKNFSVTAIDSDPNFQKFETSFPSSQKLSTLVTTFESFNFSSNSFDIVIANYALPFCEPKDFDTLIDKIKQSLKVGGIFCGQLFGPKDSWANNPNMTFHTLKQIQDMWADMEILVLRENEEDSPTAEGDLKHWHVFDLIVRRRE